ncbi:MAG: hypothetical protein H6695_00630 [Deferribacteres bacterium]|nr:hypothetical protein [Deferribacteres bacterium]
MAQDDFDRDATCCVAIGMEGQGREEMKLVVIGMFIFLGIGQPAFAEAKYSQSLLGAVETTELAAMAVKGKQQASVDVHADSLFATGLREIRTKNWHAARVTFEKVLLLNPRYPGAAFFKTFALDKIETSIAGTPSYNIAFFYQFGAVLATMLIALLTVGIISIFKVLHRYEMLFLYVRTIHWTENTRSRTHEKRLPWSSFWRK